MIRPALEITIGEPTMPEFLLDRGTHESAVVFNALDAFTQAYIEAMFWTECNEDSEELADATFAELAPEALDNIQADCAAFQSANADLLAEAYARPGYGDESQAGHDYWLTRNGHGVGFWDRDALDADGLGDRLSDACRHSSVYCYRGDDGLIYLG